MSTRRRWWMALMVVPLVVAACGSPSDRDGGAARDAPPNPTTPPTSTTADVESMPDLVGLSSADAGRRLGELGLGSEWRTVMVRCEDRPGTVVRQSPAPGAAFTGDTQVRLGIGALDLEGFRGPCEPADGDLGPVTGPDAALAREFYRFAADPSLGAPFVDGDVWTGIEDGLAATTVSAAQRADLDAWLLTGEYAEQGGPFSALDVLAGSGGYYELHQGIVGTCPAGDDDPPPDLAGLRAISLTVPEDSIDSCLQWWGVTLFLEGDQIQGVALRIGSP
ncbi:PASTA domain-containing protein [Nocardioides sp. T2.26MG-1]|uniref:PASTA domain-containing protein n=1 Tax=Nocardioides sp. T2.26MG-1 TaxID=3041166 RepID=UPI0024779591|nr:PASTA domain-containing protein [Nocardioides sp. T2.26MG-1]CAI9416481.1 hypothetical protein HIDPHFAB_02783 [Nocardioides sp. T2.26MG-1]